MLEKYLIRPTLSFILKALFQVEVRGSEHYAAAGDRLVIVSNHQSFLDPLLLAVFTPEKPAFAMNVHQARKWYFAWVEWIVSIYKIDPLAPMSFKTLMTDVKKGTKLVIFPEGRITTSGGIMKIYDGAGRIIEKTGATLLPVHIDGAQYSKLGRMNGKLRTRWFPKITISFMPPKRFAEGEKISALTMYDILTDAAFAASNYRQPLLSAMLEASNLNGDFHAVATDISRDTLSYRQMFTRAFILSEKLEQKLYSFEKGITQGRQGEVYKLVHEPKPDEGETLNQTSIKEQKFVGVLLPNSLGVLVTFVALQILGKVPAMLNFSAGAANILHACNIAIVKTILTSRAFVEKGKLEHIIAELEKNHTVIYLEDIRPTVSKSDKIKGLIKAVFAKENLRKIIKETDADAPAVVLFTSGSEGVPKGVALSHSNILSNINQAMAVLDITPSDILFNAMPVFHSFGLTIGMLLPVVRGVKTFLYPSPLHYRVVPELAYDCDATIILGTDTFFNGYARYANPYDFHKIRLAVLGAEKVKESTIRTYADKFRVNLLQGYGVTEASPVISFNTPIMNKEGSVGRAFPEIECKLEPVSGMERGGKLLIKGANVMLGYLKADKVGEVQPQGEWYDTGDIVEIDENGFITIIGRAKRFAKIGGEMVSLALAEDLASHINSEFAHASIAVSDEKKGEHIILYSEWKDLTREMLLNAAREKGLPDIALPKHIHHIEAIPRLGTGKIDYPALAKLIIT